MCEMGAAVERPILVTNKLNSPFNSLESAQEYMGLLADAAADAHTDVLEDITVAGTENVRRQQALQLVDYKLTQLRRHIDSTHHLLNDLRTLRRLLLGERQGASDAAGTEYADVMVSSRRAA
jgi:hypothetical protein